jgi:hypothetical protein
MLAHFHYANKGEHPILRSVDDIGVSEVAREANLTTAQAEFVQKTAKWASQQRIYSSNFLWNPSLTSIRATF